MCVSISYVLINMIIQAYNANDRELASKLVSAVQKRSNMFNMV